MFVPLQLDFRPNMLKNIIFDLGNVIINIDVQAPVRAFAKIANKTVEEVQVIFEEKAFFRKFEIGDLDEDEFRAYLCDSLGIIGLNDADFDAAWNTVLLDIPPKRIECIQQLKKQGYRLFLLSNTSPIHIAETHQILKRTTSIEKLDVLFDILFLSYQMKKMKPDNAIYEQLLVEAGINAEETLFLDDLADNINAASAMGIQTILVQKPTSIENYLAHLLI
jgi:glucose-1-phosphatase